MPAPSRAASRPDAPAPAPFKKRSFTGTLAAVASAVASSDPIKVSGEVTCTRHQPMDADGFVQTVGYQAPPNELRYTGRLRIPRAKSRGLIVGYEYRLAVAGDDVTAPLDIAVKFVGTPDGANPDVIAVDFVGQDARELANA